MNSFFLYHADANGASNALVCYIASFGFDFNKFSEVINIAFDKAPFSREIILISPKYNEDQIRNKLLSDEDAIKLLKQKINNYQILNFHVCLIGDRGGVDFISKIDPLSKSIFSPKKEFSYLIKCGIKEIIVNRKVVMESNENYHFVKPSGKHTSRFIKAANAMECGAEISFLAINFLKFLPEKVDKIYTDTSGIFPLAYELLSIWRRFGKENCAGFIDSFGSYQGLDSYEFSGSENSLVIISASTSDDLSKKLKHKVGLFQSQIVSLFSSCPNASEKHTIVKFKSYFDSFNGLDLFRNFESKEGHDCSLCIYERSIPLSLSNSQFIFEAPKTKLYLPIATDSDSKLREIISRYKDTNAFRCLFDGLNGKKLPTPEYFIDVSQLILNNDKYKQRVDNFVRRSFPLSVDLLVHADDQGAKDLAIYIQNEVRKSEKIINLISISGINDKTTANGVAVVAGSLQSGKSLLDISRKLRSLGAIPITYIVGFAKYNNIESFQKLKNDLEFNNGAPELGKHAFFSIDEFLLPINEHRKNSWTREEEVLLIVEKLDINTTKSMKILKERRLMLKQAKSKNIQGLGDAIFLRDLNGKNMSLSPTFAFWNEIDAKAEFNHQATVYFTISSILQSLRYPKKGRSFSPLGFGYVVNQLDPLLFDRFNEGIIQAAVLRAAKPRELDFSADDRSSAIVGSLIEKMVKSPDSPSSEALPEFLMSLCTYTLQIKPDHINFIRSVTLNKNIYPLSWILIEYLKSLFFNTSESPIPF